MPNEAIIDAMAERHQLFTLQDLEEGWPELGHGLRQLLEWDSANGDVEDIFCRDYDISLDIFGKGVVTKSLMKGKDEPVVPVTNMNREDYVKDYCTFFMYTAQREQILALRRGMRSVIGSKALNLCTAEELEMVVCGLRQGPGSVELDLSELESVAEYDDGYSADHITIK
jgi:ubiquitin-protein ligase E3 A